jgi:hypothetical protein
MGSKRQIGQAKNSPTPLRPKKNDTKDATNEIKVEPPT